MNSFKDEFGSNENLTMTSSNSQEFAISDLYLKEREKLKRKERKKREKLERKEKKEKEKLERKLKKEKEKKEKLKIKEKEKMEKLKKKQEKEKEKKEESIKISTKKLYQRILIIPLIIIIITFGGFEWLFYFRYSLIDKKKIERCSFLIIFCYINIMLNYILSCFVNSTQSKIEKIIKNEKNHLSEEIYNYENIIINDKLNNENYIYCEFCKKKKFIRSSHCRICNICILGRDHHCPYIANCVGIKNYQYFFNFLIWAIIDIFLVISFFIYFLFKYPKFISHFPNYKISSFLFAILILFNVGLCYIFYYLIIFIKNFFSTIYNNKTIIEGHKKDIETNYCFKQRKYSIYNPYNIGFLNHFYYCIGNTLLHSIFPLYKIKDYNFNEEIPIFQQCKQPSQIEIVKMVIKNDIDIDNILNSEENEPSNFLEYAHKIYRGKTIV